MPESPGRQGPGHAPGIADPEAEAPGPDLADTGEPPPLPGRLPQPGNSGRGDCDQKFVILSARKSDLSGSAGVPEFSWTGGHRDGILLQRRAHPACPAQTLQIDFQAVTDVDGRGGEPVAGQEDARPDGRIGH